MSEDNQTALLVNRASLDSTGHQVGESRYVGLLNPENVVNFHSQGSGNRRNLTIISRPSQGFDTVIFHSQLSLVAGITEVTDTGLSQATSSVIVGDGIRLDFRRVPILNTATQQSRSSLESRMIALINADRPDLGTVFLKPRDTYCLPSQSARRKAFIERIGHSNYCFSRTTRTVEDTDLVDDTARIVDASELINLAFDEQHTLLIPTQMTTNDESPVSVISGTITIKNIFQTGQSHSMLIPALPTNGLHKEVFNTEDGGLLLLEAGRKSSTRCCDIKFTLYAEEGIYMRESFTCEADGKLVESENSSVRLNLVQN
ncbi:uncharacterized protein I303_106157 [Kwoniella dejecticola CBS 10117]|uniref:Uncharacterized protein n=1 Tax=Kwoniella dejecticola CBS 10117 TaxID=1296121 RepID=A0A1A6A1G9_9TREE|nr:uncharacterized protein I303_06175 [Kwoniella dejecticola CBS 10117]OBR83890.1 hypothetical protein I303_06175 [Kwoniella dejecticola CBS 10117]